MLDQYHLCLYMLHRHHDQQNYFLVGHLLHLEQVVYFLHYHLFHYCIHHQQNHLAHHLLICVHNHHLLL